MVTVIYPNGNKIIFKNADDYGITGNCIGILKNGNVQASIYRMDGLVVVKSEDDLDLEEFYDA